LHPNAFQKRLRSEAEKTSAEIERANQRLDELEPKIDEMLDLLRRVTHAIETGGVPGTLDEETGPSVPRRRRPKPEPEPEGE
jgi:hypothetical protein